MHLIHNENVNALLHFLRLCLTASMISVVIVSSVLIIPILPTITILPFIALRMNSAIVLTINILYILVLAYSLFLFSKAELTRDYSTGLSPSFYISIEIMAIAILTFLNIPHKSPFRPSLSLVLIAIITAPIIEEIIFRFLLVGIPLHIYTHLKRRHQRSQSQDNNMISSILIVMSATIFGALHYQQGALGIAIGFLGGILLGIIYIKFGLPHAIASHSLINTFGICTILTRLNPLLTPLKTLQAIIVILAILNLIVSIIKLIDLAPQ